MKVTPTGLLDFLLIEPTLSRDDRSFFLESWNARGFVEHGHPIFVEDNHSRSALWGVLRVRHDQVEQPQGKLVGVVAVSIFDVAVDIRRSPEVRAMDRGRTVGT